MEWHGGVFLDGLACCYPRPSPGRDQRLVIGEQVDGDEGSGFGG